MAISRKSKSLFAGALVLALLTLFQNCTCSGQKTKFHSSASSTRNSGGNGDGYTGKPDPGQYFRLVPGYTCGGSARIYQSISVAADGQATLTALDPSTCANTNQPAADADLVARTFNPDFLTYKDAVFERRDLVPDPASTTLRLPETFCRSQSGSSSVMDLAVQEQLSAGALTVKIFSPQAAAVEFAVAKSFAGNQLSYRNQVFELQVDIAAKTGHLIYRPAQQPAIDLQMYCVPAGWIDPDEPLKPAFALNFSAESTAPGVTVARATPAKYFDAVGILRTAPAGAARVDFDPITRQVKGLLIESAATNLILNSEQLSAATYPPLNMTVIDNQDLAPDGTTSAEALMESAANAFHGVGQAIQGQNFAQMRSCSAFVKAAGRSTATIKLERTNTDYVENQFDLNTGVSLNTYSAGTGSQPSSTVTAVGNGWFRVSVSGIVNAGGGTGQIYCSLFTGIGPYAGNGTVGILAWGFQSEVGLLPSSYITTGGAPITRAADAVSASALGWYNTGAGTFLAQARRDQYLLSPFETAANIFAVSSAAGASYSVAYDPAIGFRAHMQDTPASVAQNWNSAVNPANASLQNLLLGYGAGLTPIFAVDGGSSFGASAAATNLTATQLSLGDGHLRSLTYWPRRLTNAAAIALTQ